MESQQRGESERHLLASRTSIVATGTLLSRGLGLARDVLLAALMPRGTTDVFFVAFAIPSGLRQLFADGSVSAAAIPLLSETREHYGEEEARRFYLRLRGLWLAVLVVTTALGVSLAPKLCELFAPGFHRTGQFERLVTVTRWVFAHLLFMGAAALGMGALTTHRRFAAAAFSPALVNVGLIVAAVSSPWLLRDAGVDPAVALAVGAVAGGALQVIAQWPSLRRIGYLQLPRFDLAHPGIRAASRRIAPLVLGMLLYFVNIAMARRLLSGFEVGAQSYFSWAFRLCAIPQGLFVIALATAALPTLSGLAAAQAHEEVSKTFAYSMRLALFVAIPATAVLSGLASPLVVAFFQRGVFGVEEARETAAAVAALGLGVPAVAAIRQLTIVFNAYGDTRTPVLGSGINLCAFVATAMLLGDSLGHVAISAGYSLANAAQMVGMWILLRGKLGHLRMAEVARSASQTLLAACAALGPAILVVWSIPLPPDAGPILRVVPASLALPMFTVVFLGISKLTRSRELAALTSLVRQRATSQPRSGR